MAERPRVTRLCWLVVEAPPPPDEELPAGGTGATEVAETKPSRRKEEGEERREHLPEPPPPPAMPPAAPPAAVPVEHTAEREEEAEGEEVEAGGPPAAAAPSARAVGGGVVPVVYQLVFPDGKVISVIGEALRVFGREDFRGYIPDQYLRLITRRSKGGQFMIYCQAKDVNNVECYIRDDFSTNPTLVNGVEIQGKGWVKLRDGDIISPAGVVNIWFRLRR